MKLNKSSRKNILTYGVVITAFIIMQIVAKGGHLSSSLKGMLVPICAYVVMAVSLNLTVGILGELSLGHAGFMSIGAFTGIIISGWLQHGMSMTDTTLRLIIAIAAGGVLAGIALGTLVINKLKKDAAGTREENKTGEKEDGLFQA